MEEHIDPPIEATHELEAEAEAVAEQQPVPETVEPTEPATAEAEEKADEPEEPTVADEEQTDGTMEVDEPPNENESQTAEEPASEAAAPEVAAPEAAVPEEDTHATAELSQPEETEEPGDENEAPHAMEVSDFNEHEHDHDAVARASEAETNALMDTDDHEKTVNDTEKSMEASTMNVSVSDDPFDSLRTTVDAEKSGDQAKSTANSERDPDETGDDNEDNGHDDGEEAGDETAETENQTADDVDQPDDANDDVTEEHEGVDEDLCLLPDEEREITEAEKEQAILAIEESEKAPEETETAEAEAGAEDPEKDDDVIEVAPEPPAAEEPAPPVTEAGVDAATEPVSGETPTSEAAPAAEGTEAPPAAAPVVAAPTPQPHVGEKVSIWQIIDTTKACMVCKDEKLCKYRYKEDTESEFNYICDTKCIERHAAPTPGKFLIKRKKYVIQESVGDDQQAVHFCVQCSEDKKCKYYFEQQEENFYVCEEDCLNLLLSEHTDRLRKRTVRVRNLAANKPTSADADASKIVARSEEEAEALRQERESSFIRRCMQCFNLISISARTIQWETMDFCNEKCLGSYQNVVGANCTTCCMTVPLASLGKYCVRFGFDIRQFCSSSCLDTFKKKLRVCSYCQNDIPGKAGMLAPVGDKGQFKDFCTKLCLKKYEELVGHKKKTGSHVCSVCNLDQPVKVTIVLDMKEHNFCSQPCFSAFKFVNNVNPDECTMCCKYFERKQSEAYTIYQDNIGKVFCSKICFNIYIIMNRKIVACSWCKVKKYNFDMIHKLYNDVSMCSLNCLTLCEVSMNAIAMKRIKCDHCKTLKQPQYHLTMSDASIRNFCTYQCVMSFQSQFNKQPLTLDAETASASASGALHPVPTGLPKRVKKSDQQPAKPLPNVKKSTGMLVISNVESLAANRGRGRPPKTNDASSGTSINLSQLPELRVNLEPLPNLPTKRVRLTNRMVSTGTYAGLDIDDYSADPSPPPPPRELPPKIELRTQVVHMPSLPAQVANAIVQVRPMTEDKGVLCKPIMEDKATQTDAYLQRKIVIPIPVPIYMPTPMHMYSLPLPIPVPLAVPIPVPVFIPTTRNAAPGIMKEIKKIQDKMPTDPFEAELLMMAEMVAGDAKKEDEPSDEEVIETTNHFNDGIENNTSFNEDLVQMALKMASNDYEEPVVDLESAMHTSTINQGQMMDNSAYSHHQMMMMEQQQQQPQRGQRGRKRQMPAAAPPPVQNQRPNNRGMVAPTKRQKRDEVYDTSLQDNTREPTEKPDANMCLKYTFGVNAWKQWVMTKNADLEKSTIRRKPFKSEILQLTADELNFSLCLFVKEVRKPNGSEYAPDTIYYLVLGIQQYLFENGRIDNIFTDPYYERFTDCLDEVAKKFSVLYNDSQYIVTRVEEEHLWECKQLGAHSPHVLLSTLMFFNTKHFNLVTVEEHMELSFSHIMKHWKRNPNSSGAAQKTPGSRNVLLRFYPPQASLVNNSRKKKVYEQQENEENPLRCPVKLYEFYLSKCPESVKTRNDVFYLQPERSCVPDSPVWYSTQALNREGLSKMLHRVKMVKEINIALLTS